MDVKPWRVVVNKDINGCTEIAVCHTDCKYADSWGNADESKILVDGIDNTDRIAIATTICKALNKDFCPNTCQYCKRGEDCGDHT